MIRILVICSFMCFSLYAEEDFGIDESTPSFTIQRGDEDEEGGRGGFWSRGFSGSIGHAGLWGVEDDYRGYSHFRLRFNHTFSTETKLFLEGLAEFTHIEFLQTLEESPDMEELGKEKVLVYKKFRSRAEEAYISQDITTWFNISYGIKKVVWGQFEPYSPANFSFPFNLSTTDIEFSKVKGALPQQVGVFSLYPSDNTVLSLYFFPELTYDGIIERKLNDPDDRKVELPKGSDQHQYAARLMFYPAWGTFGLSYYDGHNTSNIFNRTQIGLLSSPDADGREWYEEEVMTFAKSRTYSFELAVPQGRWTYKLEYALIDTERDLHFGSPHDTLAEMQRDNVADYNYLQGILDNGGSLSVGTHQDILALGTTAELDRWHLNLTLFYLNIRYQGKDKELVELEEETSSDDDSGYDGPFFPGLIASYYLSDKRDSEVGMALGIISNGQGGALFYRKRTDSLVYGLGLQSISYFSDETVEETGVDEGYRKKNDFTTGVLASLTYKF